MSGEWKISNAADALLHRVVEESRQRGMGPTLFPSVLWSTGGEAWRGSDPTANRIKLPPEHTIGVYNKDPRPALEGFVFVPSERLGFVVFWPSPEDRASPRRLIDYDGESIVVR